MSSKPLFPFPWITFKVSILYLSVMHFSWSWCQFHLSEQNKEEKKKYIYHFHHFILMKMCIYTTNTHTAFIKSFMVHSPLSPHIRLWTNTGTPPQQELLYMGVFAIAASLRPSVSIHLSPGFILLVFFGLSTWSFGFDMASSICKEGTADIPLWLLWDTKSDTSVKSRAIQAYKHTGFHLKRFY